MLTSRPLRWLPKLTVLLLSTGALATVFCASASARSLRFYGHGVDDIDRVKIRIDDPALAADPGPPADIGSGDFTIEFWVRGKLADNSAAAISCSGYDWIEGNILFDRDRFNQGRAFGLSFASGRAAFGLNDSTQAATTICGTSLVLDGAWHHVSIGRRGSDGWLWLHVDGALEAEADGPDGDVSYPDDGTPNPLCGSGGGEPCTASDPFIVLGAEKHDAGAAFPSFSGWIDELRLSTTLRYGAAMTFTPTGSPFVTDASTAALYSFDEQTSGACRGTVLDRSNASGGPSNGTCNHGGTAPSGPVYSDESPFDSPPPNVPGIDSWAALATLLSAAATGVVALLRRAPEQSRN